MQKNTPDEAGVPASLDVIDHRAEFKARLDARLRRATTPGDDFLRRQVDAQLRFLGYSTGDRVVVESLKPKLSTARFSSNWFARTTLGPDLANSVVTLVERFAEEALGLFLHADTIRPDATSKLPGDQWVKQAQDAGFTKTDVTDLRVLKLDMDPTREGGTKDVSATKAEGARAFRAGAALYLEIAQLLGSDDALALLNSGNGVQVHVRLDRLPNAEENVSLIKRMLFVLDALYSVSGEVSVDTSLWDPRRLVPLAGTMKMKGANDKDLGRVHRQTWIAVPKSTKPIDLEQLRLLASTFESRLSRALLAEVEAKLGRDAKLVTGPRPPSTVQRPDSDLSRCDAVPIRDVAVKLGINPDEPECPGCKAKGSRSDTSVRVLADENCFKCLHATCRNFTAHPVKLVARVVLGLDDLRGNRDAVRQVLDWFKTNFNVETSAGSLRRGRKRLDASGEELTLGSSETAAAGSTSEGPIIRLGTDTHRVVDEAVEALRSDPDLYTRGNVLVRVLQRDNAPVADPVTAAVLRAVQLSRVASWEAWDQRGRSWKPTRVPKDIAQAVHELHDWPHLRQLTGIIDAPVMRQDGSVLDTPGYDAATGLLYAATETFAAIPSDPTRDEVDAAKSLLSEVVSDFPFVPSARGAWFALVLTYFGRPMFEGPSPGFAVDANVRAAGKGLLCDVTGRICLGRPMSVTTPTEDEEELRKRITSTLMRGAGMALVDNLPKSGEFGNATWDMLLTATRWEDRSLGANAIVALLNLVVWVVNGNNIRVRGDTTRRLIHIRMETELEQPERRDPTSFAHTDLRGWVTGNRSRLVVAALTLLRAWVVAGRPRGNVRLGSYESWSATIGACVQWLGLGDVTATQAEYERRLGDTGDGGALRPLLSAWWETFGASPKTASEVLNLLRDEDARLRRERQHVGPAGEIGLDDASLPAHRYHALREAIVEFSPSRRGGLPDAPVFGKRLGAVVKQVAGGRRLVGEQDRNGVMHWKVAPVAGASGGSAGAETERAPALPDLENDERSLNCGGSGGKTDCLRMSKCPAGERILHAGGDPGDVQDRDQCWQSERDLPPQPPRAIEEQAKNAANDAGEASIFAPASPPAVPPQSGWVGARSESAIEDEFIHPSGERIPRLTVNLVADDGRLIHVFYGGAERIERMKEFFSTNPRVLVQPRRHVFDAAEGWLATAVASNSIVTDANASRADDERLH